MKKSYQHKGIPVYIIYKHVGCKDAEIITDSGDKMIVDVTELEEVLEPCLGCCDKAEKIGKQRKLLHHILFLCREGVTVDTIKKELEYAAKSNWQDFLLL